MEENGKIDIKEMVVKLWHSKLLFVKVLSVVFVLSVVWILPQPRYYRCSVQLAPETSEEGAVGSLGSLASSFGFNLGGMSSSDAIYPTIYPHVVASNDFLVSLFDVQVVNQDGTIRTSYYDYISNYTKVSIWMKPIILLRKTIKKILPSDGAVHPNSAEEGVNAFWLTDKEDAVVGMMSENISCTVDDEFQIISITVTDQDRLIAATMADSVRVRLQQYITDYRTSKARNDLMHYEKLVKDAKAQYDKACAAYAEYSDSHMNPTLQRTNTTLTKLDNDMQQAYTTYNAFVVQQQAATAKIQERTPAFTVLQGASVPIKPAGPKRMIFCLGMLVLGFMGTCIYILRKEIFG